jgi:hypothetical protein
MIQLNPHIPIDLQNLNINFTVTVVRNMHSNGKMRSTEQFNYFADSTFTALRIWMQTNFDHFNSPKGGLLFIAIHPADDKSSLTDVEAKVRALL